MCLLGNIHRTKVSSFSSQHLNRGLILFVQHSDKILRRLVALGGAEQFGDCTQAFQKTWNSISKATQETKITKHLFETMKNALEYLLDVLPEPPQVKNTRLREDSWGRLLRIRHPRSITFLMILIRRQLITLDYLKGHFPELVPAISQQIQQIQKKRPPRVG